ncbi:AAA family ATPase [Candidatus Nomurabacteria bacterium]|nr:AAA family ATPase [Candidatus Nomurabacteria bacterium]
MFKKGLVIGKFYPPHRGHKYLIDTAQAASEEVTVIVCYKQTESIPGYLRAAWIQQIHPQARVMLIEDNKLSDDDSKGWAAFTKEILGYTPDAVFTSEDYGDAYASFMGSVHVLVDRMRTTVPVSGTLVRSNAQSYLDFLEPVVRAYFVKRVCVLGAESTGTTTLAKALAEHYQTAWVPEYGRYFSEGKLPLGDKLRWRTEEFVSIAKAQQQFENSLAETANKVLIADTDAFATSVWHERYLGTSAPAVEAVANTSQPDLYIVTGDEIPFEQDGTRDGEHIRHGMHTRFIEKLTETKRPFLLVQGTLDERMQTATKAIDMLLV